MTAFLKRERGLAQGCLVFYVRSCLSGLQRRLMPVLSLSCWELWAFESLCVWGGSGGHSEAPVQGSFLRLGAQGSGHLVRYDLFSPCMSSARAAGAAWLGGSFGLGAVVLLHRRLALFRGALLGSLPCAEWRRRERGAIPGAQGCPRWVSFLGLRGVLAVPGALWSWFGAAPVIFLGSAARGQRAQWPEGPLAGSKPAFFIQAPELAGVKHFSGIYY